MIKVFYGPKTAFEQILPTKEEKTTLIELAVKSDAKNRKLLVHIEGQENKDKLNEEKEKISCLIAYSDDYSGLSENAIQSFISFLNGFDIKDIYLQNPPAYIIEQLDKLRKNITIIEHQS